MVYNWGHLVAKDNEALDKEFQTLKKSLLRVKDPSKVEKYVLVFLDNYLKIGEDPTDTVIRDRVWNRLLSVTKKHLTEKQLDVIWNKAMTR